MDSDLTDKVAGRVIHDSLHVRKGESVTVETWNNGLPFARRVLVRSRETGATPLLVLEDEKSYVEGLRKSPKDVIGKMGRHEYALLSKTDAYVFIPGPVLGGSPRLTRGEVIASTAYNSTWYKAAKAAGLRGARLTFGYVGEELARILVKSVGEIVDHQLVASMVDSQKVRANGKKLARLMKTRGEVVVRAEGDALRFRLGGEQEIDDGMIDRADLTVGNNMTNVPPGYLARETVPGSLSGAIKIHAPVPRLGAMGDVRLEFAGGKLKSWESEKNQEWLNGLVTGTPDQRRTLSAVVIGLNPSMKYRYGQDRLVEGAVTLFGMFQGTTRNGSLEVDGRLLIDKGRMLA